MLTSLFSRGRPVLAGLSRLGLLRPRVGVAAVVCALSFALTGCLPPAGKNLTVIKLAASGQPKQLAVERRVVAEFEKANPDVQVELLILSGDARQKLQAMIAGRAAPDVFFFGADDYPTLAKTGALLDLEPFLARQPLDFDDMYELPQRLFLYAGKHYGLGQQSSGLVLFYNVDFFGRAGLAEPTGEWTWDDYLAASEKLVQRRANNPQQVETYGTLAPDARLPFLARNGRLVDDLEHPTRCAITAPESRAGLELIKRIARSPGTQPPEVGAINTSVAQRFVSGKAAMFFDGRWRTPDLAGMKYRWNVAPVPRGQDGRCVTSYGGTGMGISSQTQHAEAAWRLLHFYLTPAGQKISAEGGRLVPVYKSLAESRAFLDLMPGVNLKVFADTMLPGAAASLCSAPVIGPKVVGRFLDTANDMNLGIKSVEEAAARIEADVTRDLQLYRETLAGREREKN